MSVKARKQGNSLMVTIPKEFNLEEGVEFEPILESDGLKYKFKRKKENFADEFDDLILIELFDRGIKDKKEFIHEFKNIKSQLPKALNQLLNEGGKSSKVMSRGELEKEIGLWYKSIKQSNKNIEENKR